MNLAQPVPLAPISREASLRDQVTSSLRAALISGALRPGIVYSAPTLAEMLGVSATPVREAMIDLTREGLVETLRNRGFRIAELSDRQLDNFAHTRMLLEVPTMGEVASLAESSEITDALNALREPAAQMEKAVHDGDMVRFIELDTDFHTAFLALAGNEEIVRIVRILRDRSRLYGLEAMAVSGVLEITTVEHVQMIDLALARNRTTLEALVTTHIGHVRTVWADRTMPIRTGRPEAGS